jgi:hypothetical protein
MGYTHYWESHTDRIPEKAVGIIREVLDEAYADGVIQREYDDTEPPLVSDTVIRFNGIDENGHETFCFSTNDQLQTSSG